MTTPTTTTRREFLAAFVAGAGCFAAAATLPFAPRVLLASGTRGPAAPRYRFPQGLASGDPTPSSVVLWTRVEATDGGTGPVALTLQVATTPDFGAVVLERSVTATAATDHTVRVLATDLTPDTRYFYRFVAGHDATDLVGRTRTAPTQGTARTVRLAFASCQAYEAGYYGAWRLLVNEDAARPDDAQLDLVVHLGDFVYEALGYGGVRHVAPFPSGGAPVDPGSGKAWANTHAVTVDDYRHLYRTYLADPDLRAARARWPFVVTWDDHEFSDDCWQTASTYAGPPAPAQQRRLAANQAWFEFIPALLTGAPAMDGIAAQAHDFRMAAVHDAPLSARDGAGFYQEPNNVAAVGSLAIYRSVRWGRHVELVVGDNRSYRSEHCIPAEIATQIGGAARYVIPQALARVFDAGRAYDGGRPPATVRVGRQEVPNVRRDAPPGTMLGARQRAWWESTMRHSDATWKLWANSVPLMPMRLDFDALDPALATCVFTVDTWEGYQLERQALMRHLDRYGVTNVVSLTGDNHNNFAGVVAADFESAGPLRAQAAELAVAGVSSTSVWQAFRSSVKEGDARAALVTYDPSSHGQPGPERPALNTSWLWGARSSATHARTGDVRAAYAMRDPRHNRHLAYVDSSANGIGVATIFADRVEAELITIEEPSVDRGTAGARVLRRARFVIPAWRTGESARLVGPVLEGDRPFPLDALAAAGSP